MFGKPKYTIVKIKKKDMPGGLCTKCSDCGQIIFTKQLKENMSICPKCDYHFVLSAKQRMDLLIDEGTFIEYDQKLSSIDIIGFKGPKTYVQKIKQDQKITGLVDAVLTGQGEIDGKKVIMAVTDSRFIMGSMGAVVGERITRATEKATELKLPIIIVSGSGGGARMYEGLTSLMQMAKTSAALAKHKEKGLLFISVLTNPTMAGIMASFASLGDVTIAEPKALIGFTGPRVIEQTIRQTLPAGFQSSEFLIEHGMLDLIVNRKQMKILIAQVLDYLT
ncbi:MAG: acetyl-CoA carboxylase, carboxyltransferase subunit beta [Candidatus Omnitrophica bacterium]|nr:acetyl-CoA carboxylase, carboxyltransferase subunit beta [Candidatus Omnitrophota bacterium]